MSEAARIAAAMLRAPNGTRDSEALRVWRDNARIVAREYLALLEKHKEPALDCPGVMGGTVAIDHLFVGKPSQCARCGLALADYKPPA